MRQRIRTLGAGLLGVLVVAGPAAAAATAPVTPQPRLAVMIAVDGLNYDRLLQYRPWYTAGLKRLLDEGADYAAAHYRHINTETGPGHSSLATGAPPRVTGIVANRWFERNPDGSIRGVSCATQWDANRVPGTPPLFYQEQARDGRLYVFAQRADLLQWRASGELGKAIVRPGAGPGGETLAFDGEDAITLYNLRHGLPEERFPPRQTITGPGNLRVPSLGDVLVESRPGARVVSLSAKDRAATFLAGRDPRHVVYWFDKGTGRFVTSSAYDSAAGVGTLGKALVAGFNRRRAGALLPARFGLHWTRLAAPVPLAAAPAPFPALADFQLTSLGLGFDHDLTRDPLGYFDALYTTPYIDELLADLALEFIEDPQLGLGRGGAADLLALSFSAQDVVSHSFGPESEENLDTLRRLDLQLGRLLDALDRLYPKGSVTIALSSDHGFAPIPEAHRAEHAETPGGRLVNSDRSTPNFIERLNRLLSEDLCLPPGSKPLYGADGWSVMYNHPAFPMRRVDGACGPAGALVTTGDLDLALPRVALRFFGDELSAVYPIAQLQAWRDDDPVVEFLRNDLDLERSGDAFLVPRPFVLLHWDPARGSGHGTHHEYDTHVPLIFWGGPFRAGRSEQPATPYDLAPTLADLLGLELKDAVGRSRVPR